jgi:hypothetical protein
MSLRQFARRCHRSHRAAQKAINDGRIPASAVRRDKDGRIAAVEYHQASACWRANSSPSFDWPEIRSPVVPPPVRLDEQTLVRQLGVVLGIAFTNALLPACAMAVHLRGLDAAQALDVMEDLLLATMFSVADALNLDPDDDRLRVLFRGELQDALHQDRRSGVVARIATMAVRFAADQRAAQAAGEV